MHPTSNAQVNGAAYNVWHGSVCTGTYYRPVRYGLVLYTVYLGHLDMRERTWTFRSDVPRSWPVSLPIEEDALLRCNVQDGDPYYPEPCKFEEPPTHCYFWAVVETPEAVQKGLEPHLTTLRRKVLTKRQNTDEERLNLEMLDLGNGALCVGEKQHLPVRYGRMLYMVYLGECDEKSHVWVRDDGVPWERVERVDPRSAEKMIAAYDGDPANRFFLKMGEVVSRKVPTHCYLWGLADDYSETKALIEARTPALRARILKEHLSKRPPPPPPEPFKPTPKTPPAKKIKPAEVEKFCSVCKQKIEKWESKRKSFGGHRHTNCEPAEMKPLGTVAAIDADGRNVYVAGYRREDGVWVCPKATAGSGLPRVNVNDSYRGRMIGPAEGCTWKPKFRYR